MAPTEDILAEVWHLKDENAAEHRYDIQAIGLAAQKHQQSHPDRVVPLELPAKGVQPDGDKPRQ
jgi:hypothetical protein